MYSVFEVTGHKLPSINTQASPSKIQKWKSKAEVKRCYNNLFKKVKDGQLMTYMSLIIDKLRKENKNPSKTQIADKFTHSDNDSHDGNDVNDGGDRAADDRAGAADDNATNDDRLNDGAVNDGVANNGTANNGIADDDILSIDFYNTEEEGQYVNSLLENYGLHRK
ncbi:uncharacterized protein OCT59_026211 [Rhizophagus irregularis]|uniref:uncharacterized protein n=1 Tax=Rhizophagus irregularis TaxID=588596 RepID=UPI003331E3FC|nr:hypothetical protein OCT59_026211 [Rhizophagus irregularis]